MPAAARDHPGVEQLAPSPPVTRDGVRAAAARIAGIAHRTHVLRSGTLDRMVGAHVLVKCEARWGNVAGHP